MAYAPTLTASSVPSPQVRVTFDSLAPGTARLTLMRTVEGDAAPVRDAEDVFAAGGFTVVDYEIPTGYSVAYAAIMFDGSGNLLGTTDSSVTKLWGEPGWGWISDPLVPGDAVEVQWLSDFTDVLTREREVTRHSVGGRLVALLGAPGLLSGVNLSCHTPTDEMTAKLRRILAASSILVRTSPPAKLPPLFYALADKFGEVGFNVRFGGESTTWKISADELSPSSVSTAVSSAPYAVYMAAFSTYAEAKIAYATYLDAKKNPPGV